MGSSFSLDLQGLHKLIARFQDPALIRDLNAIPQEKAVAALVAQAIADNFDKEGPGWAALKASTIRASVSKKLRKKLAGMGDKELLKYEAKARKPKSGIEPNRMILQKTGLLKKAATTPGYSGSNKSGQAGSNIYKVEGTNLIWGVDLVYAKTHNQGDPKRKIPKREFLVIRDEWMQRLNDYMVERMLQKIKQYVIGGGA